jgi:hypothetical protein
MFGLLLSLGRGLLRMRRAGGRALRRSLLLLPLREAPPPSVRMSVLSPPPVCAVRVRGQGPVLFISSVCEQEGSWEKE